MISVVVSKASSQTYIVFCRIVTQLYAVWRSTIKLYIFQIIAMKSFVLSIPDRIKRSYNALDVKTDLCRTSWEVFNNEGMKQVFIFKKDGNLLISTKGNVVCSSWEYLSINQSVLIKVDDKISMYCPTFVDDVVLVMKKDGTDEYVCMIDEKESYMFPNRNLDELQNYFAEKERKLIFQEQEQSRQLAIKEKVKEETSFEEAEEDEEEKETIKEIIRNNKDELCRKNQLYSIFQIVILCTLFVGIIAPFILCRNDTSLLGILLLSFGLVFVLTFFIITPKFSVASQVRKIALAERNESIRASEYEIYKIYREIINEP